jgi:hypothetical protein
MPIDIYYFYENAPSMFKDAFPQVDQLPGFQYKHFLYKACRNTTTKKNTMWLTLNKDKLYMSNNP